MKIAHVCSIISRCAIRPALTASGLVAALAAAPAPALAQHVLITVNGEAITDDNIEQRTKFNLLANHGSLSRQQIIDELIDDKLKLQIARRNNIKLTGQDVDQQHADMAGRMRLNADQLTQMLSEGGIDAATLNAKILADVSWKLFIRARFHSRIQAYENGINYTLRQIVLPAPGGDTSMLEARRKDADALRARFTDCESGLAAAEALHDVIIRPPIIKNSGDFTPAVREILDTTERGHLTPAETTARGIELVAVCEKKEAKDERPEERAARVEAFSETYLHALRRGATIRFMQ